MIPLSAGSLDNSTFKDCVIRKSSYKEIAFRVADFYLALDLIVDRCKIVLRTEATTLILKMLEQYS